MKAIVNFEQPELLRLPPFKPTKIQINPEAIDLNNLKFPETRKLLDKELAKGKDFLQTPTVQAALAKSELFTDTEFRPCVLSVVDDIRDPDLKVERRMEWRRCMFIGKPKRPQIWFDKELEAEVSLQSKCSQTQVL